MKTEKTTEKISEAQRDRWNRVVIVRGDDKMCASIGVILDDALAEGWKMKASQ